MSMNLAFKTSTGDLVDFPFQTPTNLSYKIANANSTKDRLDLVKDQLKMWKWNKHQIDSMIVKCAALFADNTLRLIVI